MRNRVFVAVALGSVALWLCQWLVQLGDRVVNAHGEDLHRWPIALLMTISSVAAVLPGLCAGFISGVRGFLVGALAGALGSMSYGAVTTAMLVHSGNLPLRAHTWVAILIFPSIYGVGLVLTCAVGGAAGELLRSNNRWRGP